MADALPIRHLFNLDHDIHENVGQFEEWFTNSDKSKTRRDIMAE
jgi:hypothetical protein